MKTVVSWLSIGWAVYALAGEADLGVTVVDFPDPIAAGDLLTYDIAVTNNGPDDATSVELDVGFTVLSPIIMMDPTCTFVTEPITCTFALAAAETKPIQIVVRPLQEGNVIAAAGVRSEQVDPNDVNDLATTITEVVDATGADMGVAISDAPDPVQIGGQLSYSIDVTNFGPQSASNAELLFVVTGDIGNLTTLTPGCNAVASGVSCVFPNMTTRQSETVQVTGLVGASVGTIQSAALVAANEADNNEANNQDTESTLVTLADVDGDSVPDAQDNCVLVANENQRDTNGDGFGNACDADITNDCAVNFGDLAEFKAAFTPGPYDPDADFDGDGFVNFGDLALMKSTFFNGTNPGPGPSGVPNDCEASGRKRDFYAS